MLQTGRSRIRVRIMSLDFFFNLPNPLSRTMAVGSTWPLTEMSTRNLSGGGGGDRRIRLTILPPSVSRSSRRCGSLDLSHPYGPTWPVIGTALSFFTFMPKILFFLYGTTDQCGFLNFGIFLCAFGRTPWTRDWPLERPLSAQKNA
jgi:hypothetical protein